MAAQSWRVGVGTALITPEKPVRMAGYYFERISQGVHDDLHARTLVIEGAEGRVALVSVEVIMLSAAHVADMRRLIGERYGLTAEQVLVCCTHTHTGPSLPQESEYLAWLKERVADSVGDALSNTTEASMFFSPAEQEGVSFVRRYRMKDGTVRTNPGLLNPDVDQPLGEIDPEVLTLRIVEDGQTRAVVMNFALHCDTVGGDLLSAGWPFYVANAVRDKVGAAAEFIYLQGCSGDINHWNVFKGGHFKGFEEAERIGKILGPATLRALENEQELAPGPVAGVRREVAVPLVSVSEEDYAKAKEEMAKPYESEEDFTMERVEMQKRVRAYELPGDHRQTEVQALRFGDAAFVGMPCEYFNALGRQIKAQSPCKATVVCELANDCIGYVGEAQNYDEGGYELASAACAKGSGEFLRDEGLAALREARG